MKKLLPQTKSNTSGFTLIELLVVIAIIAILAVVGLALFSGVQQKARDARRQADVLAIAKSYEVNKAAGTNSYVVISSSWFGGGKVPLDTTTAQYTIIYVVATGCSVTKPTAWSGANATQNGAVGTSCGTPQVATLADAIPNAAVTAFQICALLENGTNNIFCVPNAQ